MAAWKRWSATGGSVFARLRRTRNCWPFAVRRTLVGPWGTVSSYGNWRRGSTAACPATSQAVGRGREIGECPRNQRTGERQGERRKEKGERRPQQQPPLSLLALQRLSFVLRPLAFGLRPLAFVLWPSSFGLRPLAFGLQASRAPGLHACRSYGLQPTACRLWPKPSSLPYSSLIVLVVLLLDRLDRLTGDGVLLGKPVAQVNIAAAGRTEGEGLVLGQRGVGVFLSAPWAYRFARGGRLTAGRV